MTRRRTDSEAEIDRKFEELGSLEEAIEGSLKAVADRFTRERETLIQEFLALEPLLQRVIRSDSESPVLRTEVKEQSDSAGGGLRVPIIQTRRPRDFEITEEEYFERFVKHVEASGFTFDRDVLLAFHLSAKGRDPVILGGFSGTGKSSLPVLYSEALIGEEGTPESWQSMLALLGQVLLICLDILTRLNIVSCHRPQDYMEG